ncbi:hypothetical protein D3C71_384980 [compost metagenome]
MSYRNSSAHVAMIRTFFAYHLTHVFGPFGLDSYYTNSENPTEGDLVYVLSGDKDPEDSGVDYFLEGVFRIRRRRTGPWSLKSIRGEVRDYRYRLSMEPVRCPDAPIALELANWYSRKEMHRYFSSGQNFNPLPTDPDYKARLDKLLAGYASNEADSLVHDLAVLAREISDETERDALTKARIGQGKFRADLVASWRKGETCALTGIAVPEMLIASHIKPWRDSTNEERLDPMNGLLLVAHADKLFDRYLLSFDESRSGFQSVLHPRLRNAVVAQLGLKSGMPLDISRLSLADERRLKRYMSEHLRRHRELVEQDRPPE